MTPTANQPRDCRRLADLALLACTTAAIASLPAGALPWPWTVALLLPGALLGGQRASVRLPFRRAAAATALQLLACWWAWQWAGPLTRPAALAGTILPPLAFVTVRRQQADAQLGLFLGFCVLLVGTILGSPDGRILGTFAFAALVQLRCDTRLRALHSTLPGQRGRPAWRQLAACVPLLLVFALAALATERLLAMLPAPALSPMRAPAAANAPRRSGLDDTFELGGDGRELDLRGERLVSVATTDGSPVPADLYLRTGFFQVAGLDSWQVGALDAEHSDASTADYRVRQPVAGRPVQRLEITRLLGARNRIFVPPGTCTILGVPELQADRRREWFRQAAGARIDVYEVDWQDLPAPDEAAPEPRQDRRALLALPRDLDRTLLEPLLAEFGVRGSAFAKARAIADGLQRRCRYELREPEGPYGHALLDFLHGGRFGFCMHFASATALLLRLAGVPCRIGVGLYGGLPGDAGQRDFGAQHSHAWVEIPIAAAGFMVFDPTPPARRGSRLDLDATPAAPAGGDDAAGSDLMETARSLWRQQTASPWPWLGLLAGLAALPFARRRRTLAAVVAPHPNSRPARRLLVDILRTLARLGYARPRGTTLEQHARTLAALAACPPALTAAFAAYQEVRFGGRTFGPAHEDRLRAALLAVQQLPPRQPLP